MRIPENLCMLQPKALKMRAIKHTMALITDSSGRTKCAPAQMPWHLSHLNPALLNRQGMCTYPKMENGSELCHWKGQLVIGLRANPVRPRKPLQIGAKLGTPRGSITYHLQRSPNPNTSTTTGECQSSIGLRMSLLQEGPKSAYALKEIASALSVCCSR